MTPARASSRTATRTGSARQDIHKIVDVFNKPDRDRRATRAWCRLSEIAAQKNNYNLNIPRYIDSSEPEDIQDLDAHLNGGIPQRDVDTLDGYWNVMPSLREELFEASDRSGYLRFRATVNGVKEAILTQGDFVAFQETVCERFEKWRDAHLAQLRAIQIGDIPKQLIAEARRILARRLSRSAAARPLRHLPAPNGLLGRGDARRRLPDLRRRLVGRPQPAGVRREGGARSLGKAEGGEEDDKARRRDSSCPPCLVGLLPRASGRGDGS